jgi:ferric-dicitrate binding protein FerR (iron transport regulator)
MNAIEPDFHELFNRLADGLSTAEDEQQLAEVLRRSADARRAYREFMALHSALHWDYVAAVRPEAFPAPAPPAVPLPAQPASWLMAFLAGIVLASVVGLLALEMWPRPTPARAVIAPMPEKAKPDEIAALLVDEFEAEFAPGRGPEGVRLGPGEYELRKGIVHLRFAQGADVVLASPARLEVKDSQHTRLVYGKVRVIAPPTAKGFTIATRAADYVDLGTEFGLRVDGKSGASDLYVFDGQVNIADPRSGKVLSEVLEGKSSRYVDGAGSAAPKLKENEFPTPGAIGFERWQHYEQRLRRDPGLVAFYPFRRTADERVLLNQSHEAKATNGCISGARWTSGRWPGKEALLFDRDSDLVQIDIPGEYQELTIAVWLKVDRLDFGLNAILNSDGYEPGDLHFQLTRQGLPRGGVVIEGPFDDKVVGEAVSLGKWTHVASVMSTRTRSQQIYVNGVLARERHWRQDEILRPGSCRLGNWLPDAQAGMASRALRGRIDELAIWNRALPAEELKKLVEAGRPGLLWNEQ